MLKSFLLLLSFISFSNASELIIDNKTYSVPDKPYVIRCIEGFKYIQFVVKNSGRGGIYYYPEGNPQQMFQSSFNEKLGIYSSFPISCN